MKKVSPTIITCYLKRLEKARQLKLLTNLKMKLFKHRKEGIGSTVTHTICETFTEALHQTARHLYHRRISQPCNWSGSNKREWITVFHTDGRRLPVSRLLFVGYLVSIYSHFFYDYRHRETWLMEMLSKSIWWPVLYWYSATADFFRRRVLKQRGCSDRRVFIDVPVS